MTLLLNFGLRFGLLLAVAAKSFSVDAVYRFDFRGSCGRFCVRLCWYRTGVEIASGINRRGHLIAHATANARYPRQMPVGSAR